MTAPPGDALTDAALAEKRHQLLAEHVNDVIWTMALDGTITYVSPAIERVRGISAEEAMAQELPQIHPPDSMARSVDYFTEMLTQVAAGEVPAPFHGELEYYCADGSTVWCDVQCFPHVGPQGRVVELLGVSRDISERRRYEQQLRDAQYQLQAANADLAGANSQLAAANAELARLATTDSLTGVANRRHFDAMAEQALGLATRHGHALALLLVDVDHFKAVNDTAGHLAGDRVLIELARRLQGRLRATDLLARWGGEEFAVLLPHTSLEDAVQLADSLRALVAGDPVGGLPITVSVGVTSMARGEDLDDLLARVDRALYAAKGTRNFVKVESA